MPVYSSENAVGLIFSWSLFFRLKIHKVLLFVERTVYEILSTNREFANKVRVSTKHLRTFHQFVFRVNRPRPGNQTYIFHNNMPRYRNLVYLINAYSIFVLISEIDNKVRNISSSMWFPSWNLTIFSFNKSVYKLMRKNSGAI